MKQIKIFISYAIEDKIIASYLKEYFRYYYGFKVFVAHSDIAGACEWEDSIFENLKNSDYFIPLISESFKKSDFASQEVGIAIALDKKIIPIKLGTVNPYGFIAKYQALKGNGISKESALRLVGAIFALTIKEKGFLKYKSKAIDSVIDALSKSESFEKTRILIRTLIKINNFNSKQIKEIVNVIKNNNQVKLELYALPTLKQLLLNSYKINVDSMLK